MLTAEYITASAYHYPQQLPCLGKPFQLNEQVSLALHVGEGHWVIGFQGEFRHADSLGHSTLRLGNTSGVCLSRRESGQGIRQLKAFANFCGFGLIKG